MLIGKFAEKYQISIDTVRYYMELGLLIPKKKNHYYDFDRTCEDEMTLITELKGYRFSLQEINQLLAFKRVTLLSAKEDFSFFIQMLEEKKQFLTEEITTFQKTIIDIEQSIETYHAIQTEESETKGLPFEFLPILYCPSCQIALELKNVSTKAQQIIEGDLCCAHCEYTATIHEGIIETEHLNKKSFNPFYLYDIKMLKTIQSSFVSLSEKAGLYIKQQLLNQSLHQKIILETNVETYVFLNKYLTNLDPEARYIFTGSTLSMLKMLKTKIEKSKPNLKILYILNSGLDLPFRYGSIDYMIDSYSFNEYSLFHPSLPMEILQNYLHHSSHIIGCYFYYQEGAKSLVKMRELHPNANPANLSANYISKNLRMGNYQIIHQEKVGSTANPGEYLKYHVPGETAQFNTYHATNTQ